MSDTNYNAVSVIEQKHRTLTMDEKEGYIQLCRKSIADHIKQATGLSEGEVSKVDVYVETFVVDIDYSFSGDVDVAVCSDRLPPSPEHSVVGTKDELVVRLASQRDSDLNNTELRQRFEKSLTEATYCEIKEETELYTNPMAWMFYEPCQECGGQGSRTCTYCHGHGNTPCFKCKGSGQIRCELCRGIGRKHNSPSVPDYYKPCPRCGGTGIQPCNICKGRGYELCSRCNGRGVIRCEHCAGTGWLTTIARSCVKVKPAFSMRYLKTASKAFKDSVSKIGLTNMRYYGEVKYHASERDNHDNFIVHYVCRLLFAEAEVSIKGKKSKWLLCGKSASVLDAGGAMDNVMEDVISAMQKSEPSLFRPYADVSSSIADFMSYDINKSLLSESIESDSLSTIQAGLKNAVSVDYISDALKTLTWLCKYVQSVNSLYFAIMFALLSAGIAYVISPVYVKLEPPYPSSFFNKLPYLIVVIVVPIISAWISVKVLNRWYRKTGSELFYEWRKKKRLLMHVPFYEMEYVQKNCSGSERAEYFAWCFGTTLPGILVYLWVLSEIH